MDSEEAFARYAQPLGLQYTVSLRYHFKNDLPAHDGGGTGTGVDRTAATGSAFVGQYPPQIATRFEELATTPQPLVLFLHQVALDQVLPQTGETTVQTVYDLTFSGVAMIHSLIHRWEAVRYAVDERRWREVRRLFDRQLSEAINYRNVTNRHFFGRSGITDRRDRSDGLTLPTASVPDQTVAPGAAITGATSSEPGRVYLVPTTWSGTVRWEREARLDLAADRLVGATALAASPGAAASLLAPQRPDTYHVYAVDRYGNVSGPSTGRVTVLP
jgi:hypothetical protein